MLARVIDFEHPVANDWLAVNQLTVEEGQAHRRPDVVLYVNGIPLVVVELKNPADEDATIWSAHNQLQTYKLEIPSLLATNALLVVSDGVDARLGTLTGREGVVPAVADRRRRGARAGRARICSRCSRRASSRRSGCSSSSGTSSSSRTTARTC